MDPYRDYMGRIQYNALFRHQLDVAIQNKVLPLRIKEEDTESVEDKDVYVCAFRAYNSIIFRYNSYYWTGFVDHFKDLRSVSLCSVVRCHKAFPQIKALKTIYPQLTFADYKEKLDSERDCYNKKCYWLGYQYNPEHPEKSRWEIAYIDYLTGQIITDSYPDDKITDPKILFEQTRKARSENFRRTIEKEFRSFHFVSNELESTMKIQVNYKDPFGMDDSVVLEAGKGLENQLKAFANLNQIIRDFIKKHPTLKLHFTSKDPQFVRQDEAYLVQLFPCENKDLSSYNYYNRLRLVFLNEDNKLVSLSCSHPRLKKDPLLFSEDDNILLKRSLETFFHFTQELPLIQLLRKHCEYSTIASGSLPAQIDNKFSLLHRGDISNSKNNEFFTVSAKGFHIESVLRGNSYETLAAQALQKYSEMNHSLYSFFRHQVRGITQFTVAPQPTDDTITIVAQLPAVTFHWFDKKGIIRTSNAYNHKQVQAIYGRVLEKQALIQVLTECQKKFGTFNVIYWRKEGNQIPWPLPNGVHIKKRKFRDIDLKSLFSEYCVGHNDLIQGTEVWSNRTGIDQLHHQIENSYAQFVYAKIKKEESEMYILCPQKTRTPLNQAYQMEHDRMIQRNTLDSFLRFCFNVAISNQVYDLIDALVTQVEREFLSRKRLNDIPFRSISREEAAELLLNNGYLIPNPQRATIEKLK